MDDLNSVEIGRRLKEVRGKLTQADFADQLGIARQSIRRYEMGERLPDALTLFRIMSKFGADPAWILTGEGAEPALSEDERQLLTLFRSATLTGKMAAVGALQGAIGLESSISSGENAQVTTSNHIVRARGFVKSSRPKK